MFVMNSLAVFRFPLKEGHDPKRFMGCDAVAIVGGPEGGLGGGVGGIGGSGSSGGSAWFLWNPKLLIIYFFVIGFVSPTVLSPIEIDCFVVKE